MSAVRDYGQVRIRDQPLHAAPGCKRDDFVLLSPDHKRRHLQLPECPVQVFAAVPQVCEYVGNGGAVSALEMQRIRQVNQRVRGKALVIKQVVENFAQVFSGGHAEVDGELARIAPNSSGVYQDKVVDSIRRLEGEGCGNPAAQRVPQDSGSPNSECGEESLQHIDK